MADSRIRSEFSIIVASLFVACIIWLMAKMSALETDTFNIPVFVDNMASNVKVEFSPKTVPIVVRFPQSQRARVSFQSFEVRLTTDEIFGDDPTRPWAGVDQPVVHTVNVSLDNVHAINLPQSVRVSELGAQSRLTIEATKFTQSVPVKIESQGTLPVNYELSRELTAEPPKVVVTAPPDVLKRFSDPNSSISTEPVKLDDRRADFIEYSILQIPEGIELVDENQKRVQVFVGVKEKEVSRTISGVPVEIFVFAEGLRAKITPSIAEVKVKGRISVLDQLTSGMFRFAPKSSLAEEIGIRKGVELAVVLGEDVELELRKNTQIEGFSPPTVDIEFVKAPATEKQK